MNCEVCHSETVSYYISSQGVIYECHSCGHAWLEPFSAQPDPVAGVVDSLDDELEK